MLTIRPSNERGHVNFGWLDSYHSFSFGDYYDPNHMGFRGLRVINEDRVAPGGGFPTHPHRDMEIISFVLEGALEHRDSLGHGEVLRPGEVQAMSAGRGIAHSEFNPSRSEGAHFLQIWIRPRATGLPAAYGQKKFDLGSTTEGDPRLTRVASPDGREGSLTIQTDAHLLVGRAAPGRGVDYHLAGAERHAWVQVTRGSVRVLGAELRTGDGAAISKEEALRIEAGPEGAEFLLFDLA